MRAGGLFRRLLGAGPFRGRGRFNSGRRRFPRCGRSLASLSCAAYAGPVALRVVLGAFCGPWRGFRASGGTLYGFRALWPLLGFLTRSLAVLA